MWRIQLWFYIWNKGTERAAETTNSECTCTSPFDPFYLETILYHAQPPPPSPFILCQTFLIKLEGVGQKLQVPVLLRVLPTIVQHRPLSHQVFRLSETRNYFRVSTETWLWHQGRQSIDSRRHMDGRQSMDYGSSPFAAMPPPEQINDMFEQMLASVPCSSSCLFTKA